VGTVAGGAGFSVGFTREWFARASLALGLTLKPCIYNPEIQRRLVQEALDEFLANNAEKDPDYWNRNRGHEDPDRPRVLVVQRHAGDDFATRLATIAPVIKDESFADEREWRLVADRVSVFKLRHRPGNSMLIPYYSIPIGDDERFDSIREIVVGPTPHPDLSAASARSLAAAAGLVTSTNQTFETRISNIPFRSW
jgi:hypothetical protein